MFLRYKNYPLWTHTVINREFTKTATIMPLRIEKLDGQGFLVQPQSSSGPDNLKRFLPTNHWHEKSSDGTLTYQPSRWNDNINSDSVDQTGKKNAVT